MSTGDEKAGGKYLAYYGAMIIGETDAGSIVDKVGKGRVLC